MKGGERSSRGRWGRGALTASSYKAGSQETLATAAGMRKEVSSVVIKEELNIMVSFHCLVGKGR